MPLPDLTLTTIDQTALPLSTYAGRVLLIVNVASQCGFTKQYEDLEAIYRSAAPRGLTVLGFPCDQFGHQEPGDAEEIKNFCRMKYDITFPLFAKVDVNGPNAHPLFVHLKQQARGLFGTTSIKWNFTKFLVGRDGTVLKRFSPRFAPYALLPAIESALAEAPLDITPCLMPNSVP